MSNRNSQRMIVLCSVSIGLLSELFIDPFSRKSFHTLLPSFALLFLGLSIPTKDVGAGCLASPLSTGWLEATWAAALAACWRMDASDSGYTQREPPTAA